MGTLEYVLREGCHDEGCASKVRIRNGVPVTLEIVHPIGFSPSLYTKKSLPNDFHQLANTLRFVALSYWRSLWKSLEMAP